MNKRKIIVGSRDSQLAIVQSKMVMEFIRQQNPEIELVLKTMKTTGDLNLTVSLPEFKQEDLFTIELERALKSGEIDICVHSYKDFPLAADDAQTELPIVAISKREDPRDALILPSGVDTIDFSKPIGSSSLRRGLQFKEMYPQAIIESIRGNVISRIEQLDRGDYGGIILAMAGLNRLNLEHRASEIFTVYQMMPSASQGFLAVQGRAGESFDYLKLFNDPTAFPICQAERAFTRAFKGGFSSPVAAYATVLDGVLNLSGMFVDIDNKIIEGKRQDKVCDAAALAEEFAKELLMVGSEVNERA